MRALALALALVWPSAFVQLAVPAAGRGEPASEPADLPWVGVDQPGRESREQGPTAWVEVRGRAGTGPRRDHDVVIALDLSGSTWRASGFDVDRDGKTGRLSVKGRSAIRHGVQAVRLEPRDLSTDLDDTIRAAELCAARGLLERLDPERTHVGLIAFADRAVIEAPLGAPSGELLAALGRIELRGHVHDGGTDLAAAVEAGAKMLAAGREEVQRTLVLLTDGQPTQPVDEAEAARAALEAAKRAAALGVRIHAFDLAGEDAGAEVLVALARATDGRVDRPDNPGEVAMQLPNRSLAGIERVEIRNRTNGSPGAAVLLFADGTFDGFSRLEPGWNDLEIQVVAVSGARAGVARRVHFTPRTPRTPEEARALEAELSSWVARLEARSAEVALRREMEAVRRQVHERWVEVEARP